MTVAMRLGQFQRLLSCDLGIGLHICDLGIGVHICDLGIGLHICDFGIGLHICDLGIGVHFCDLGIGLHRNKENYKLLNTASRQLNFFFILV